jgi:glycerol-3-phosphate dehydrogenase
MQSDSPPAEFDLIVIGAGINGAAIAREAALSGLATLLLDAHDVGGATSAASTRLIHGGLRYLEHGELSLVYESLHERERLLERAAHLVEPLGIYLPLYAGGRRKRWQIRAGLTLYDVLSAGSSLPCHRTLDRAALRGRLPGLAAEGLIGGAQYYDAQARFPERLVLENVIDAVAHGAQLRTHAPVTAIRVERGRATGVEWRTRGGGRRQADAACVVNAAGPWVDRVLGPLGEQRLIGGTKGSHIVVPPFPGAPDAAVYTEAASDGRPFFIVPWNGSYLIGTTDERYDADPGDAAIDAAELDYLVTETQRVFPGAAPLRPRLLYTQSGVRPLLYQPRGKAGAITRRHLIHAHRHVRGLYSVVGGKLTTHRALAEDVLARLPAPLRRARRRSPTRERDLPGHAAPAERDEMLAGAGAALGPDQAQRLWRIYGSATAAIADRAAASEELSATLGPDAPTLVAELVHAIEAEWAVSLTDILYRRSMAGLAADFGRSAAPAAARWLERLGLWDAARAEQELAECRAYIRRARPASL